MECFRRALLLSAILVALVTPDANAFVRGGAGGGQVLPPVFTPAWQTLKQGAGGQLTDISIDPSDDTTLIRTDTYGAYLYKTSGTCAGWGTTYSPPCWQQLITSNSIPSPAFSMVETLNYAVAEVVACKSDTNKGYMIWNGNLYYTANLKNANGPPTWVATTETGLQSGGDQTKKNWGRFLACDPNNPDVLYISKPGTGTRVTINGTSGGSATFATVGTVGGSANGSLIAIDYTSAFSGGFTQRLMICSIGAQCWVSTNGGIVGGGSFTQTTSGPTAPRHLHIDKFGQFWVADGTTSVYRYSTTSWATLSNTGAGTPSPGTAIATDPRSSSSGTNRVITVQNGGQLSISNDNGATWTGDSSQNPGNATSTAPQPVWLNTANQSTGGVQFLNSLGGAIDSAGTFWNAAGIAIWTTPSPVTQTQTPWAANVIGIEEFVTNQVVSPPGQPVLTSMWDRGFMLSPTPDKFPTIYYNNSTSKNPIMGGWSLDYASAGGAKNFVSGWERSNVSSAVSPASSSDGGVTWTAWPNNPSLDNQSGNIAVSTPTNWIVVPGCSACGGTGSSPPLYFTTNAAASAWTPSTIAGTPTFSQQVGVRFPLAADRVTAGSFCVVDLSLNFYNSTNSGANFTLVATSADVDGGGGNGADTLVSVPFNAGHYFYTSGSASGAHPVNSHLWKSTNSCDTWTNVNANLKEVMAVGFGAPKPGGSGYPVIYAYGWLTGTLSFVQSNDAGATWAVINAPASEQVWPGATLDFLNQLSGDSNVYGRFYTSSRASGGKYIDVADACPSVNFTNIKPTQALTGASVSLTAEHSGQVPVTGVNFYIDGVQIGVTQTGQTTYSVSLNASGQTPGAHTLKVEAVGNGCTVGGGGNSFSIPITTS